VRAQSTVAARPIEVLAPVTHEDLGIVTDVLFGIM
jgi:hypothetical protein